MQKNSVLLGFLALLQLALRGVSVYLTSRASARHSDEENQTMKTIEKFAYAFAWVHVALCGFVALVYLADAILSLFVPA